MYHAIHDHLQIAVMDYFPVTIYQKQVQFWPVIDNKLRQGEEAF